MNTFKTFEDLLLWQKAHQAALLLYKTTDNVNFNNDYALKNQMRRAVISISSNIAEGHERKSNKEFSHFISIAKASSSELRSQLILSKDLNYISNEDFESIKDLLIEINKMSAGLIKFLSSKPNDHSELPHLIFPLFSFL